MYNEVHVDGNIDEWEYIPGNMVDNPDQLWIGQDLVEDSWEGKDDLSFEWKACRNKNRMFFLFVVRDNVLVEPAMQANSFLNDCIEIMLDPENRGGPRFTVTDQGKILHGYEMHFLPAEPNHVFLNDSLAPMYPMESAQDSLFRIKWKGEIVKKDCAEGYVVEIGFEIPGFQIANGTILGMDVDVCDDDGDGRKNLMIWSGTDKEFWLNMNEYPKVMCQ